MCNIGHRRRCPPQASSYMVRATLLQLLLMTTNATRGPCADYFGAAVQNPAVLSTVIDPDVTKGFPFGHETFVHYSGPRSRCIAPSPPQGCHRYFVASYGSPQSCAATEPGCALIGTDGAAALAGNMDTDGLFDRGTGVLKSCAACLQGVTIHCWQAPADEPVACGCPGTVAAVAGTAPSAAAVAGATVAACVVVAAVVVAVASKKRATARSRGLLQ